MKRSKKVIKLFQVNTPSEDSLSLQHGSTIDPIQASVGFSETNPQEGVRRRKQLSRSVWGQDEKKGYEEGHKDRSRVEIPGGLGFLDIWGRTQL